MLLLLAPLQLSRSGTHAKPFAPVAPKLARSLQKSNNNGRRRAIAAAKHAVGAPDERGKLKETHRKG
jgi:hypothetical protein